MMGRSPDALHPNVHLSRSIWIASRPSAQTWFSIYQVSCYNSQTPALNLAASPIVDYEARRNPRRNPDQHPTLPRRS
ncbi:hypothetical protein Hypma_002103 [Hypsizygus marmoreus]|uniref:Uncharacterized protein n=1 Tax=Hypsizygus marmoreus TaxID=39966 RepID=A0A369K044_HYPMA|nr:hypothetical protein Hypma_002103 [Hypsizygus marmoreus]